MLAEESYTRFAAARAQPPPRTSGDTLHWDGMGAASRGVGLTQGSEPAGRAAVPVQWQPATGSRASPAVPARALCLLPSTSTPAIDWGKEAVCLTFYLDPGLLLTTLHDVISGATGTLMWVHGKREEKFRTPAAHPALLVHTAYESLQVQYAELVPHLPIHDPLLHHSALVLQAAVEAEGVAGRLYAEVLANVLAVHLLSRYAIGRHRERAVHGGLPPSTLRRTVAYVQAHLEHELSLTELAAVAQMSPAHFGRLFKQATGRTPHQYVLMCRMERAKRLLTETALPLHEVGARIGYTNQSHFTALFRQHVTTTPKAYRAATGRA